MDRVMIRITDLLAIAAGDDSLEVNLRREVEDVADELNSVLPEYEVMVSHLDTDDYLIFTSRDPLASEEA